MNIKLINETKSELLNRKELEFEATYESATPKKEEIKKLIASSIKAKEEQIVIKKIHQVFGIPKSNILAHIYNTPEDLKKVEIINKKKKPEKKEKPKE